MPGLTDSSEYIHNVFYKVDQKLKSGEDMKKILLSATLIILNTFVVYGVEKSNQTTPLKIKGFYLGMPLNECVSLINSKYHDVFVPNEGFKYDFCNSQYTRDMAIKFSMDSLINTKTIPPPDSTTIDTTYNSTAQEDWVCTHYYFKNCFYDPLNNIINGTYFNVNNNMVIDKIIFENARTNLLFNCTDLSLQDFLQMFIDNYKIPYLKPDEYNTYWSYFSPNGWRIDIRKDKEITIRLIPKNSERKFD